jgi:hypothetical protein
MKKKNDTADLFSLIYMIRVFVLLIVVQVLFFLMWCEAPHLCGRTHHHDTKCKLSMRTSKKKERKKIKTRVGPHRCCASGKSENIRWNTIWKYIDWTATIRFLIFITTFPLFTESLTKRQLFVDSFFSIFVIIKMKTARKFSRYSS